jgi:Flp pilus assembly protein TadD
MEGKAPGVAEPFFRRATELRPDSAAARQQFGLNLVVQNRCAEAVRELGEAVRLEPRNADSLSHLAYCETSLDRLDAARAHAREALAVNPDDALAWRLAAMLDGRR